MNELQYAEKPIKNDKFWKDATKYAASITDDDSFVSEIAYMMVTLHRTGA